jgi:hypothetical protein
MDRIVELFFLPPMAIARVGGSDHPLEAFEWVSDVSERSAHRTVIKPAVSLEVRDDGSLRPYLPKDITFRDNGQHRPAAPFFELWVRLQSDKDGVKRKEKLTTKLMAEFGVTLANLRFKVAVANCKAQRRTGSPASGFIARLETRGDDHARKPLLASSPYTAGQPPLVFRDHPIPLGQFQVIRPTHGEKEGVNLDQIRVRFTPARGEVYGPPTAIAGPCSPVQPGEIVAEQILPGNVYEIVPEPNRILNPDTLWSSYVMDDYGQTDPQPCDSYDGADVGDKQSWGVVDDTCDGTIQAELVVQRTRWVATARVISGVPDFAPDRRPFVSLAGDLADRDCKPVEVTKDTLGNTTEEIVDMFGRVFETIQMLNLDAIRYKAILINYNDPPAPNYDGLPQIDERTMTREDEPYVDLVPSLLPDQKIAQASDGTPAEPLPYVEVANLAHAPLTDRDTLIDFLRTHKDHVRRLIRPPYGHFSQFEVAPGLAPSGDFRDPRVSRDGLHDMRMPPYMRDSDENPLSLNWRDYDRLMKFLDLLDDGEAHNLKTADAASPAT